MKAEELKRLAAVRAADWVLPGMVLGLGTGSTVRYLLEELGARVKSGSLYGLRCVPTSTDTEERARVLGIPLTTLGDHPSLDLTIDGADEIDPELNLIKGLGGALLREKIVAAVSKRLVIIADEGKLVERLGTRAPVPVEVDPFGAPAQEPFLRGLGARPVLRLDSGGRPRRTDGGNLIFDCHFAEGVADAVDLAARLDTRAGVLEHGLFLHMAEVAVIARSAGTEVLYPAGSVR